MTKRKCLICKKIFFAKTSHVKQGWGRCCSKECQYKSYMTGKYVRCDTCGKMVYKTQARLRHSVSKKHFCNKSCFAVWKNSHIFYGKNHPSWKNGQGSYREIMFRSKIKVICRLCGIKDLRVLLTHHIDGDRKNNKINNLEWLCRNCHYLAHNRRTI